MVPVSITSHTHTRHAIGKLAAHPYNLYWYVLISVKGCRYNNKFCPKFTPFHRVSTRFRLYTNPPNISPSKCQKKVCSLLAQPPVASTSIAHNVNRQNPTRRIIRLRIEQRHTATQPTLALQKRHQPFYPNSVYTLGPLRKQAGSVVETRRRVDREASNVFTVFEPLFATNLFHSFVEVVC